MMLNHSQLALRLAGRPHLITPAGANALLALTETNDPLRSGAEQGLAGRMLQQVSALANGVRRGARSKDTMADLETLPPGGEAWCPLWMGEPDAELGWGMTLKDGIACLNIDTPLWASGDYFWSFWFHGYETLTQAVRLAMEDDRVDGMFIRMDSPGGVVAGALDMLTETLRARTKPVHVHAEQACSAAYWIASQTDRISAPRAGLVGSIGAIMIHFSLAGALDKAGLKVTPVQFGARKSAFASFHELDEEGLADLQAMVDECGRNFVTDVHAGRAQLTEEALIATEARVFDAVHSEDDRSGLALGFVDEIMTEEEAFDSFRSDLTAAPGAPAPAATAAQTPTSTKGNDMAGKSSNTARAKASARARQRAALEAKIKALDEEEAEEGEPEDPDAEDEDDPAAEGEPEDPDAEDEDDPAAEGEPEDPDAEDEDDPAAEEDEQKQARADAILSYAAKNGMSALGKSLAANRRIKLSEAKRLINAAARGDKLAARRDHRVGAMPNGNGKKASTGLKAAAVARNEARRAKRNGQLPR